MRIFILIFILLVNLAVMLKTASGAIDHAGTHWIGYSASGDTTLKIGPSGDQGCFKYNTTDNVLQFAHDCTSYSDIGTGGSGFNSILTCGDMECSTLATYWTSSGSLSKDTTTFLYGKASAKVTLSAAALSFIQTVTNAKYSGKRFRASCDVKSSDATIQLCSYDGTNEIECTDSGKYTGSDEWVELSAYMVAGTSGNVGIKLKSSSMTDDVFIDNCNLYESSNVQDGGLIWPEYSESAGDFTVTGTNSWSTSYSWAIPYKTGDGWFLRFNVEGTTTSVTGETITFSGVTFMAGFYQTVSVRPSSGSTQNGYASPSSGNVAGDTSAASTTWRFSGDVKLASMPTWAVDVSNTRVTTEPSHETSYIKWYNVSNCTPSSTAASLTNLNDTDCTFASATYQNAVTPSTTGDIALKIPYLKPGTYEVSFDGKMQTSNVSGTNCVWALYDGTNIIAADEVYSLGDYEIISALKGTITYSTAQTNLEISIQNLRQGTGTCDSEGGSANSSMQISLKQVSGFIKGSFSNYVETPQSDGSNKKPVLVSALVTDGAGTTTVSEDDSDFVSGNCSNGSTGNYSCTFTTSFWLSKPHCWFQSIEFNTQGAAPVTGTSSVAITQINISSGAAIDSDFHLFCHGYKN